MGSLRGVTNGHCSQASISSGSNPTLEGVKSTSTPILRREEEGRSRQERELGKFRAMEASVLKPKTWNQLKEQYGIQDRRLSENSVEYLLFILSGTGDAREQASALEEIRRTALEFVKSLTEDFIWQRGEFSLALESGKGLFFPPVNVLKFFLTSRRPHLSSRRNRLWRFYRGRVAYRLRP